MPTILVIAADLSIESLLGELIAFAGHRPVYDATLGAAGESVRRVRADAVMLDTALPVSVVQMCLTACREAGSVPILVSSTESADELAHRADALECRHFALPGGPKPLQELLDEALSDRPKPAIGLSLRSPDAHGAVDPSLRAALASVARARLLVLQAQSPHPLGVARLEPHLSAEEMRRSRAALQAAVTDYARQLKAERYPLERIVSVVHGTVADCATVVGADAAMPALLLESETWVRRAFFEA